jgi:hypothetical protein
VGLGFIVSSISRGCSYELLLKLLYQHRFKGRTDVHIEISTSVPFRTAADRVLLTN